jgi:sortase A
MTTSGAAHRVRMAWPLRRLMVLVLALAGAGILLYPSAGAWFATRAHAEAIAGIEQQVEQMPAQVRQAELRAAHQYNDTLPPRPMKDPYSGNSDDAPDDSARRYEHTLDAIDGGVMGVLRIPTIDVNLPVYHGTGEAALEKGVGHLFGSTLPVGGPYTHSVLTAHSGMVGHTLFDHLNEVVLGDEFQVDVLGQTRTYRVDSIQTVLPEETDSLVRVADKDYITLITCTPTGVNSHRLLVRGVRVPNSAAEPVDPYSNGLTGGAGFPWWALIAIGVFAALVLLTRRLRQEDPQ